MWPAIYAHSVAECTLIGGLGERITASLLVASWRNGARGMNSATRIGYHYTPKSLESQSRILGALARGQDDSRLCVFCAEGQHLNFDLQG
jgi:hypothetical protein